MRDTLDDIEEKAETFGAVVAVLVIGFVILFVGILACLLLALF